MMHLEFRLPLSIRNHLAAFYRSEIRLSLKIIATSLAVGVLGALPLLIYVAVGPAGGKPVALGMLALFSVFTAQAGLIGGLLRLAWELFTGKG